MFFPLTTDVVKNSETLALLSAAIICSPHSIIGICAITIASGNKCFFSPSSSSSWCLPLESACDAAVDVPNTTSTNSSNGTNAHSAEDLSLASLARHDALGRATPQPQGSLVKTSFAAHRAET